MIGHLLNQAHGWWGSVMDAMRPWALPVMVLLYYLFAAIMTFNGYGRELMGSRHNHSRLHLLLWQFHTGSHVHPMRSYGDTRRYARTATQTSRATPEGQTVYYTKLRRWHRALINNASILLAISFVYGLIFQTEDTMIAVTISVVLLLSFLVLRLVQKARKAYSRKPRKISVRAIARPAAHTFMAPGSESMHVLGGTVMTDKPKLIDDGTVPAQILAGLLADNISCSTVETVGRLKLEADRGALALPDHYPALPKQREVFEEIVRAQSPGSLSFTWKTSAMPREVSWVPTITALPRRANFQDYIKQMEALPIGDFGVGAIPDLSLFSVSHRGDTPWHLSSMGSGTGKSRKFQVKLAQICHQNPRAHVYCVDTKQVSFKPMRGIPNVHIFDNPESEMDKIWRVFGVLEGEMRNRYTAIREGRALASDFDDVWLLVDEGNDLATHLKAHYDKEVKERGDPAQPPIWAEKVQPLVNLGREVGMRGEFLFQNMTDKALGGVSLRDSFPVRTMAGYTKNQWGRIIGSTFQEPKAGPGKMCVCQGPSQVWVQGLNDASDDPESLRQYAINGRV